MCDFTNLRFKYLTHLLFFMYCSCVRLVSSQHVELFRLLFVIFVFVVSLYLYLKFMTYGYDYELGHIWFVHSVQQLSPFLQWLVSRRKISHALLLGGQSHLKERQPGYDVKKDDFCHKVGWRDIVPGPVNTPPWK